MRLSLFVPTDLDNNVNSLARRIHQSLPPVTALAAELWPAESGTSQGGKKSRFPEERNIPV